MASNNPFGPTGNNPFIPQGKPTLSPAQPPVASAQPVAAPQPPVLGENAVPFDVPPMVPQQFAPPMPNMPGAPNLDAYEVDLTDIQSGFIIPDGMYPVRCIDVDQGVSNAGNPQYIWTFTTTQGEFAGRDFKLFTAITPAAMWKVGEVVVALGIGAVGQKVKFRKADVVNRECVALIEVNEYKGQKRSSISRVLSFTEANA